MKKLAYLITLPILTFLLTACDSGVSGTPMPLTVEGYRAVEKAMIQVRRESSDRQADVTQGSAEAFQLYIDLLSESFAKAGYSFEATMVQAASGYTGDTAADAAYFEKHRYALVSLTGMMQGFEIRAKSEGFDIGEFMHPDVTQAVRTLITTK